MGSDGIDSWLYIAACLVVPALWGLITASFFGRLDRRKKSAEERIARTPPVDYSI